MARARSIKPAIFKNEILGQADPLISLLFIGLWTLADREGRLEDRPLRIKAETFPYREIEITYFNGYLTQLERHGFIDRYKVGDLAIIQIVNFRKHQAPHNTEKASELPDKPIDMPLTVKHTLNNDGLTQAKRPDSLFTDSLFTDSPFTDSLTPDSPESAKPETVNRNRKPKPSSEYSDEFLTAWNLYPKRKGASKADAFHAWQARLKTGVSETIMTEGVKRYADYCITNSVDQQFIKLPATFFGVGEHYLSDWGSDAEKKYQQDELGVFDLYNKILGSWPDAFTEPYLPERAKSIYNFLVFCKDPAAYFDWLVKNLSPIPGCGFDWVIKKETYLRAREGNFAALSKK